MCVSCHHARALLPATRRFILRNCLDSKWLLAYHVRVEWGGAHWRGGAVGAHGGGVAGRGAGK